MKLLTASHSFKPTLTEDQLSKGFVIWDITAKSGCSSGWILAPTWDLVNNYKSKKISEEEYTINYFKILGRRWNSVLPETLEKMNNLNVILVCYCPQGVFCHRYLAADFLVKQQGAKYFGEYVLT